MKRYELIRPWQDTVKGELHEKLGEIIEMEDEERANRLVKLGAFRELVENDAKVKEPKAEKPKANKPKATKSTTTKKKK